MSLLDLGLKHGTDKAHIAFLEETYLDIYQRYLEPLRQQQLNLLELGVRRGSSLRMWKAYFPNGQIYGVDYNPDCERHKEDRIEVVIASQDDARLLTDLARRAGGFDVIVDDASHINHLTVASFRILFPYLKPGGYYVIEDLGMSWVDYTKHVGDPDFMEGTLQTHLARGVSIDHRREDLEGLFRELLFEMDMNRGEVHFLHFWSKLFVLRKAPSPR